jgi:hypothetical protein
MGDGGESIMKDRITLTVRVVRRSQYFEFSDNPRVWYKAVFPINGTLGSTALMMGIGDEVSILLNARGGERCDETVQYTKQQRSREVYSREGRERIREC